MNDDATVEVFLYGLFMDPDLLAAKGLHPRAPRKGTARGMGLRIGARATLVPQDGAVTHGVVMTLTAAELERLYAEPSVAAYRPEPLQVTLAGGGTIAALCYNLPAPDRAATDADYAARLREVAQRMGLPEDYVRGIGRLPPQDPADDSRPGGCHFRAAGLDGS